MRALEFLGRRSIDIKESDDARREKIGPERAAELMADADRVFVARGRKIVAHDGNGGPSAELMAMVIGPSGNLRAPTLRIGRSFVVGFNEELYEDFF